MPRKFLDDKGQTSTEYILLVAIGVLIAAIAIAGILHIGILVVDEYNRIAEYQNEVIGVLLS